MLVRSTAKLALAVTLLAFALSGCTRFRPPFNNFENDHSGTKKLVTGIAVGAGTGAVIGAIAGNAPAGAAIGGVAGAATGLYYDNKRVILKELQNEDIQYTKYGDTITLLVPTDRYFLFNSPRINDICYPGLNNIVKLLKYYPHTPVYVAAFTDDVGSRYHKKKLSQAQAETMITFLWAYDIPAQRLHAEGYGDLHDIGDNHWIRGSAYNRRIEIQWLSNPASAKPPPYMCATK
jgi:outer membrane protein OmpA-like peptidoglycan-associated protein